VSLRAFLISDNHDTLVALRLAGIKGTLAYSKDEIINAISEALKDEYLGILVVTEKISSYVPHVVRDLRERGELPLIVEVPDRHGSRRDRDFLTSYLREAIGVNIE